MHQVYFRIFLPIPFLEYKRSNDNFLLAPSSFGSAPPWEGRKCSKKIPPFLLDPCLEYEIPRPIFTRVYTREARKVGNRSRGPVVNRDRRRASRATLTGGCKQAESHAREFDGSWFSRLSAHGERRRRGEEGRYGCHVAETRQACRSPSRNFISGRNAPLSLFFFSLLFVLVRSSLRERKNSLSYGVSMLLNQFERIFIIPWKYVFRFHSKFPPLLFLGIPWHLAVRVYLYFYSRGIILTLLTPAY